MIDHFSLEESGTSLKVSQGTNGFNFYSHCTETEEKSCKHIDVGIIWDKDFRRQEKSSIENKAFVS